MEDLRIPKISVDIVCHTTQNEVIAGQIFLDLISPSGYTIAQVLEFFNSHASFFPMKPPDGNSLLLNKQAVLRVDVQGLFDEYESEVSSLLDVKREATVHFIDSTPLNGRFIIDMPSDHDRSLDLLNAGRRFIPFLMEQTITLIHTQHIYKVEGS